MQAWALILLFCRICAPAFAEENLDCSEIVKDVNASTDKSFAVVTTS